MRRGLLALLLSVGLVFGACGGGDDDEATDTDTSAEDTDDSASGGGGGGGGGTITIDAFKFTNATAAAGAEVAVDNKDGSAHTVTGDKDEFDSGNVDGGAKGKITAPDKAGEYPFHCDIHPSMKGTLTVEG